MKCYSDSTSFIPWTPQSLTCTVTSRYCPILISKGKMPQQFWVKTTLATFQLNFWAHVHPVYALTQALRLGNSPRAPCQWSLISLFVCKIGFCGPSSVHWPLDRSSSTNCTSSRSDLKYPILGWGSERDFFTLVRFESQPLFLSIRPHFRTTLVNMWFFILLILM